MSNKTLYILRGVSGSGKTTLAMLLKQLLENSDAISADDFFYNKDGVYEFDRTKLHYAHISCQTRVEEAMKTRKVYNLIVHNTSTTEKEMRPYLNLAEKYGYKVVSLVVENRHGSSSVHDVPESVLLMQQSRLINSLKLKAYHDSTTEKVLGTNINTSV